MKTNGHIKSKKLQRLKRKNGVTRKSFSAGAFQYQKDELRKRARAKGMTISYYLNHLLWHEWL